MGYLAAAYMVVWALVTGYVLFLSVRQRRMEEEIRILEETVDERANR